nr:ComEC/Rec2 family competence protein [Parvularcula maris]
MTGSFTGRRAAGPGFWQGTAWQRRAFWRLLWQDTRDRASAYADQESQRLFVFAPVLLGAGILLGDLWRVGIAGPAALLASSIVAGFVLARRGHERLSYMLRCLALVAAGVLLLAVRLAVVAAPVIPSGLPPVTVTGTLGEVELRERDRRYTIDVAEIEGLSRKDTPARVRISWRGAPGEEEPGDTVRLRASLAPPPGPTHPGSYDFSRQMFFERIGGAGYSFTPPEVLGRGGGSWRTDAEALRERIAERVEGRIGGREGAVAAALVTGKRERIPEDVVDALRDAGLAHLLAISGLHMGLVCGFIFFSSRWLLSRSERLTLSLPIKKLAAGCALSAGLFYLVLSGGAWSAQRAFIMAGVACVAILLDRRAVSLRNAAAAALIILFLRPEAVFAPGFQMSFAAVVTLIAAFAAIEERWPRIGTGGPLTKASAFLGGLFLTSLLAGAATGPFAAYHFGRIAVFGLLGNMLAMPIVTLAVMPALVTSLFLMPLGLDGPVLILVGKGIGLVLSIAEWTSSLPGAVRTVPQLDPLGLAVAACGMLTLTLLKAPWRAAGLFLVILAMPLSRMAEVPEVFLSRDLRNVGVRTDGDASLALLSKRRDKFSAESWLQALGKHPNINEQQSFATCTAGICRHPLRRGGELWVLTDRSQLRSACRSAAIVVLRSADESVDRGKCAALLIALRPEGNHPAAGILYTDRGWEIRVATPFAATR